MEQTTSVRVRRPALIRNQTREYGYLAGLARNRSRGCFTSVSAVFCLSPMKRITVHIDEATPSEYNDKIRNEESQMKLSKFLSLFTAMTLLVLLFAGCVNSDNPSAGATPLANTDANASAADEDSYEVGTSDADNIVNTTPADKVLLVVSFGTSFNQSRSLAIGGIEAALREAYPDFQIRRAFSSQIIIDKLAARDNLRIDTVEGAMNRMVLDKVKEVVIQPTTVMTGYEYDEIIDEVMPFADKFESFKIGKNLLADDSDYEEVAEIIVQETSKFRADGTAIVLMGHGTEHQANVTYAKLQNIMSNKGYNDYIIGTVEAEPTLEDVQESLKEQGAKKVVLRPLMIVAGDHANNDMAGDEEDSWKIVLTEDGYAVETVIEGLGQVKGIQDIFIKHVQNAINSDNLAVTLAATAAGVTAARISNGVYAIDVDTNSAMFKIVDCQLTVVNDDMQAVITLSGQGFGKVYMGTVEQAATDEAGQIDFTLIDGRHVFTVPVAALDRDLPCAGLGVKSGKWFDHIAMFESDNISDEAFTPCQIDVVMTGGSGKASIDSPAKLLYKDGANIAEIIWSSPNYTYMVVNGEKYLPINTGGNSVFEIPVKLDMDMKVRACTVAMSEPKEIEYIVHFDSTSIK